MNGFVGDLRAIDAAQPAGVIERLNAEIAAIRRTPDVQVRVDETGFEVGDGRIASRGHRLPEVRDHKMGQDHQGNRRHAELNTILTALPLRTVLH